jgi:hypothetical protein
LFWMILRENSTTSCFPTLDAYVRMAVKELFFAGSRNSVRVPEPVTSTQLSSLASRLWSAFWKNWAYCSRFF